MKKQVRNNLTILERELNEGFETTGKTVPKELIPYVRNAMVSFSVNAVQQDRRKRRKEMVDRLKYLPKAFRIAYQEFFLQFIRKIFLNMAIKTGKLKAYNEGYKVYVVRATTFSYKAFSTLEFKHNKKVKVLKRSLTAKDVEREASRVIYPKSKK